MATDQDVSDAIRDGDASLLEKLIDEQTSLASARDADGVSALLQAAYGGRDDMVDVIRRARPYLDLFEAAVLGDVATVKRMTALDTDSARRFSPDGFTPLHLAAHFGRDACIAVLIDAGAELDVVSTNPLGVMPLHSALAGDKPAAAAALIRAGADVNAAQRHGWTPVHYAAHNGDTATIRLLLDAGADPSRADAEGRWPRALADRNGHADAASLLDG